jgi:hypothetical protein
MKLWGIAWESFAQAQVDPLGISRTPEEVLRELDRVVEAFC